VPVAPRLFALAVAVLVLAGCGARRKPVAAPTEAPDYDWSQFTGNTAPPSSTAKQEKQEKQERQEKQPEKAPEKPQEKQEAKDSAEAKVDDSKPAAPDAAKKVSATKIGGQSVSDVSADAVATASQRATKRSLVSTNVIVGAEYEQVNVFLDNLAVQIVRPASLPDKSGPKVRSPKARKDGVAETEAAFYDPNADVLVLVQADKKATSSRALAALVSARAAPAKKNVRATKPKRTS